MTIRPGGGARRPAARPIGRPAARRTTAAGTIRRTPRIRRASAGLSPIRAGAMLAVLLSAAGIYGVANSSAFRYSDLHIEGATFTAPEDVQEALEAVRGANLFQLRTGPLEADLRKLGTVRDATVAVRLPDSLVVDLEEREAILVWRVGARRYLVDDAGRLFARLDEATAAEATGLPLVEDRRAASAGLSVGRTIDGVDLDAATRLASLTPADVGSSLERLAVLVSDATGFSIQARPDGWQAVFGFYTPTLRQPDLIPGQVRLLRSLILGREPLIERVVLASETDGTYIPKPTPSPSPTPEP
jgi:hypothetical protein